MSPPLKHSSSTLNYTLLSPHCSTSQLPSGLTETSLTIFSSDTKQKDSRETQGRRESQSYCLYPGHWGKHFKQWAGEGEGCSGSKGARNNNISNNKNTSCKDSCSLLHSPSLWESLPSRGNLADSPVLPSICLLKDHGSLL